jgi:hypothetical protein
MPYYRQVGALPPKRHTQFRKADGGLYAEELMGADGFSAESALLYHEHLPTAIVDSRVWDEPAEPLAANHPLLPRHLRTSKLDTGSADAITGRQLLLATTTCGSRTRSRPAVAALPQRGRRRVRLRRVGQRDRGDRVRRAGRPAGRLRAAADIDDAPLGADR